MIRGRTIEAVAVVLAIAGLGVDARVHAVPARVDFVPVNATGPHTINGNEIVVIGGGQLVTVDFRASGWDPEVVRTFQISLNRPDFFSGSSGSVRPLGADRPLPDYPTWCGDGTQCPPEYPICSPRFSYCVGPEFQPELGLFVDAARPDYIFAGLDSVVAQGNPGTDLLGYRLGDALIGHGGIGYEPPSKYLGTLVLEVSADASGTFVIDIDPEAFSSYLLRTDLVGIPTDFVPVTVTIQDPFCGDGYCTDDEDLSNCAEDCADAPIPTMSAWGMAALTLLFLIGARIGSVRRAWAIA
ncbi:MAG: hypothetical protein PVI86_12885 [Phycisphaerae bacterium]|jgi:hypothetical protein